MTEPTYRQTTRCSRCGAAVTGDFKFCPKCANRLRSGEAAPANLPAPGGRWSGAVVGVVLGGLAVGILAVGLRLFAPAAPPPEPRPDDAPARGGLTVRDHLLGLLVNLPPGPALYWRDPDPPPTEPARDLELYVPWYSRILRYEVTRGMYAEFAAACEEDPSQVPAVLDALWRPEPTGDEALDAAHLDYSGEYLDRWWESATVHLSGPGGPMPRPADLEVPLPEHYGVLLMVPPSWVYRTEYEEIGWRLPEDTEDLPVTEVSWYDAVGFATWASRVLGVDLRLPLWPEWIRAGTGGDPAHVYPWGNEAWRYACNNLGWWGEQDVPRPLPVDFRYHDREGRTPEGVWGMSGNAREWAHNCEVARVDGRLHPYVPPGLEDRRAQAPTLGGSFREGIQDCTVTADSMQMLDKHGRWDDVGFRLWREGWWGG